jgi:hypothetical protein
MIGFFSLLVGGVAIVGVIIYFWRTGNSGVWGELSREYAFLGCPNGVYLKRETVFISGKGGWHPFEIWLVGASEENIFFKSPSVISWLVPSLRIPRREVSINNEENILFKKRIIFSVGRQEKAFGLNEGVAKKLRLYR